MLIEHRSRTFDLGFFEPTDFIAQVVARTGRFYEADMLEYARLVLAPNRGGVAFDVGANIGNHSVFLGAFMVDLVVAIEPNLQVLPVLRENLGRNPGRYVIVERAVGNSPGTAQIVMPSGSAHNIGMARVKISPGGIRVETLDTIATRLTAEGAIRGAIRLLKIDIEGMELPALEGAAELLAAHGPEVFVEAQTDTARAAIDAFLLPRGYRRVTRWGSTPVYHYSKRPWRARLLAFYCKARRAIGRVVRRARTG